MNQQRERLVVSLAAGLCLGASGADVTSFDIGLLELGRMAFAAGLVVLFVYALELAIANGIERAKGPK